MKIRRGDILRVDLGVHPGCSIQSGIRPVVVVSNNKANDSSTVITVIPSFINNCVGEFTAESGDLKAVREISEH